MRPLHRLHLAGLHRAGPLPPWALTGPTARRAPDPTGARAPPPSRTDRPTWLGDRPTGPTADRPTGGPEPGERPAGPGRGGARTNPPGRRVNGPKIGPRPGAGSGGAPGRPLGACKRRSDFFPYMYVLRQPVLLSGPHGLRSIRSVRSVAAPTPLPTAPPSASHARAAQDADRRAAPSGMPPHAPPAPDRSVDQSNSRTVKKRAPPSLGDALTISGHPRMAAPLLPVHAPRSRHAPDAHQRTGPRAAPAPPPRTVHRPCEDAQSCVQQSTAPTVLPVQTAPGMPQGNCRELHGNGKEPHDNARKLDENGRKVSESSRKEARKFTLPCLLTPVDYSALWMMLSR